MLVVVILVHQFWIDATIDVSSGFANLEHLRATLDEASCSRDCFSKNDNVMREATLDLARTLCVDTHTACLIRRMTKLPRHIDERMSILSIFDDEWHSFNATGCLVLAGRTRAVSL